MDNTHRGFPGPPLKFDNSAVATQERLSDSPQSGISLTLACLESTNHLIDLSPKKLIKQQRLFLAWLFLPSDPPIKRRDHGLPNYSRVDSFHQEGLQNTFSSVFFRIVKMKIFILLCCLGSIEVFAAPHAQWDKPISVQNNWAYYSNGAITPTDRPDVQLAKQQFYEAFKLAQQQVQQHLAPTVEQVPTTAVEINSDLPATDSDQFTSDQLQPVQTIKQETAPAAAAADANSELPGDELLPLLGDSLRSLSG